MPTQIDHVVGEVLLEYANKIMLDIPGYLFPYFKLTLEGNRVIIWTNNVHAAYLEFGTGGYAAAYLSDKPEEMKKEAAEFYINGNGFTYAEPYLFPAYYKVKDEIPKEIDRRVQKLFDSIR
ncbi:hypothetical protein OHD16_06695 [Sphingobacterium sp. ML3W]|uniref:hypothetical protein n=1 Tax=Sphingobacterium sp. ML3W TaxID=1538644 RepID=UPI00249A27FE|nr:hypothetical protein [Sphingobacterium sp. ML3W]WFA79657.1 hypothetical protein OGI71_26935 [Sphingobacterium sp. ML3W]